MQYLIYRGNRQEGPYTAEVIRERLGRGELAASDLCFGEGMGSWTPISAVPELAAAPAPVFNAPPPPIGVVPPAKESWWTAVMEKLSVTARLTQKQAHRKKLELSDLRNADYQTGRKAYEGGLAPAACAALVAQIGDLRRQLAGIQAETPGPTNTFTEKAKETAAAAARMARIQAFHAREGLLLTDLGGQIRLTTPIPPVLAAEVGAANQIAGAMAGLDAEIMALSSKTYSWARQPLWALIAILLIAGLAAAYHWMHGSGTAVAQYTVAPPPVASYEVPPQAAASAYVYPSGHKWIVDEATDRAVEHGQPTPGQQQRYVESQQKLAAAQQAAFQEKMKQQQDAEQKQAQQQQAVAQAAQAKDTADRAFHEAHPYEWNTDQQKKTIAAEMAQVQAWVAAHPQNPAGGASAASFPASIDIAATPLGPAPPGQSNNPFFLESPDFQRVIVNANRGTDQMAYVDGHPQKAYSKIIWNVSRTDSDGSLSRSPIFSPDSKGVAYIAQTADNHLAAVIDGVEGPAFNLFPIFKYGAQGHVLVYVGSRDNTSYLYVNGREIASEPLNSIAPIISPDGQNVAYVRHRRSIVNRSWVNDAAVVLNGKPGPTFPIIGQLKFSGDSQHIAYVGIGATAKDPRGLFGNTSMIVDSNVTPMVGHVEHLTLSDTGGHYAVVTSHGDPDQDVVSVIWDGKEFGRYSDVEIDQVALSSNGGRMAFVVPTHVNGERASRMVVDNGHPGKTYDRCDDMLFSADGSKLLYMARANDRTFMVCNGEEFGPYTKGHNANAAFSPDSAHFAYTAQAPGSSQPQLYVDGRPVAGPAPDWAHPDPERSNNGTPKGYVPSSRLKVVDLSDNKGNRVALDGHAGPAFQQVSDLLLSPDGKHVAYVASGALYDPMQRARVVVDGSASPVFDELFNVGAPSPLCTTHLAFSPDGSLQFVGQQNNTLYRCTISAASIASLPTLPQLDSAGDGWRPITFAASNGCPAPDDAFVLSDGRIYGYTKDRSTLVRAEGDGSNLTLLRTFHQTNADLANPDGHLVISPAGDLYGYCTGGGANRLGGIYRIDGKTAAYSIIHSFKSVDPQGGGFTVVGFGLEGHPDPSLVVMKQAYNSGPAEILHMKLDGSGVTTMAEPKEVTPAGSDGEFGAFYQAIPNTGASAVIRYSTLAPGSMSLHSFAGPPDDCDSSQSVFPAPDGKLYGLGSPSYLFTVNRDGSNYRILCKNTGVGRDGSLCWTNGMLYIANNQGIVQISPTDGQMKIMTPVVRHLWGAHGDTLYAQDNSILARLFRFILPHSGTITPPSLNLKMAQAGP